MTPSRKDLPAARRASSPAYTGSTWIETSCSNCAPSVTCRSMVASGSHAFTSASIACISGLSALA